MVLVTLKLVLNGLFPLTEIKEAGYISIVLSTFYLVADVYIHIDAHTCTYTTEHSVCFEEFLCEGGH